MELELSTFPLPDVLEVGLTMVRERAMAHGITLDLRVADDVGEIEADERKIKQVVFNLLSNAVKFTPDGGTRGGGRLPARRPCPGGRAGHRSRHRVADQARIFEEFEQTGVSGREQGSGCPSPAASWSCTAGT